MAKAEEEEARKRADDERARRKAQEEAEKNESRRKEEVYSDFNLVCKKTQSLSEKLSISGYSQDSGSWNVYHSILKLRKI